MLRLLTWGRGGGGRGVQKMKRRHSFLFAGTVYIPSYAGENEQKQPPQANGAPGPAGVQGTESPVWGKGAKPPERIFGIRRSILLGNTFKKIGQKCSCAGVKKGSRE